MVKILKEGEYIRVKKRTSTIGNPNPISAVNIFRDRVEIERLMTPDKPTVIPFDKISYFFVNRYFIDNKNYNVILYNNKDDVIIDFKLDSEGLDGENNCEETRTLLNAFAQYKLGSDFYNHLETLDVSIPIKKDAFSKSEYMTLKAGKLTFPDGNVENIQDLFDVVFIPNAVLPVLKVIFKNRKQ